MLAFLGFGKKAQPLGYNKGAAAHHPDAPKSDQELHILDGNDHAAEEVKAAAGSPALSQRSSRAGTAEAPGSPGYLLSAMSLDDTMSEPPRSARSVSSTGSRLSSGSRRSDALKGKTSPTSRTAAPGIPEGLEVDEDEPSGYVGADLRGMTMDQRRKTVDLWRLSTMPRKLFWEERRRLYATVPLEPIKKAFASPACGSPVPRAPSRTSIDSECSDTASDSDTDVDAASDAALLHSTARLEKQLRKTLESNALLRIENDGLAASIELAFLEYKGAKEERASLHMELADLESRAQTLHINKATLLQQLLRTKSEVSSAELRFEEQQRYLMSSRARQQLELQGLAAAGEESFQRLVRSVDECLPPQPPLGVSVRHILEDYRIQRVSDELILEQESDCGSTASTPPLSPR